MENPFNTEKTRPTFLTVLCILTFIGSGFSLLSSLMSMLTTKVASSSGMMSMWMNVMNQSMNQSMEEIPEPVVKMVESTMDIASKAVEYGVAIGLTNIILYAASILGAVMMYNLKKQGFYLYSAAQVLLLFVTSVFLGFNVFVLLGMTFGILFTAAFIIMYGVNVKRMN